MGVTAMRSACEAGEAYISVERPGSGRLASMSEIRRAKLFKNGASQAVRLPAEFRFDSDEVFIRRDDATGDVVLSSKPGARAWADFFELMATIGVPDDFMAERPMNRTPEAVLCRSR
ncbi:AbrB/MazE/SpoVT family DNA-binding domain-containing protein [Fulvimarina sp. 2208YS6-2-32]|uniref:AbrB/MazE/SpoVT family DNA-binding domain-containing protein n=1 Tax=Fulvimarina uroteuthidis TaxID=3098149 RepID=A0ABU5I7K0_9HYPH|nr:AbrB/MazE/SpoVT family DNA-binding domain-containing protein [Fulvimarina sp. 2208YS6-2-32]MDY8110913.1 AbrB/MazE/SpoVT family DNA-binding domain-containing protein [Fulvimarina sp. 2208YS6-2-32]